MTENTEETMMSFEDFLKQNPIELECVAGGVPPEDFKDSDPLTCILKTTEGKGSTAKVRTLQIPFYTGKGLRKFDERLFRVYHRGWGKATQQDIYKLQMAGDYTCFRAVAPKVEDILDSLALDASGYDNSQCFEDWAGDYGYDEDSRKGERIYQAIREERNKLEAFLGRDLYQTLLYKVERL